NFLSVQAITVQGLSDADNAVVQTAIQDNLNHTPFYNPQRNLFFLSKSRVRQQVSSVPAVDAIESIRKDFGKKTLTITLKPKHELFLVRSTEQVFDIYNDGILKGQAGLNRDAWESVQNPSMIKIDLGGKVSNIQNGNQNQFFSKDTVNYMIKLQEALKGITGSPLAYFSIRIPQLKDQQAFLESQQQPVEDPTAASSTASQAADTTETPPTPEPQPAELPSVDVNLPINADELDLILQKGSDPKHTFKVIVDTKENPEQLVQRLNLLLSQTAPERYNVLSYIDLRIQSRAFVCLSGTACNH
ncbi:MAG TPA: hypothetical protein VHQ41_00420, partial [Patescibacteria group bacterium]|nr:hypothetical protein [Patescibacteria group bacterium]